MAKSKSTRSKKRRAAKPVTYDVYGHTLTELQYAEYGERLAERRNAQPHPIVAADREEKDRRIELSNVLFHARPSVQARDKMPSIGRRTADIGLLIASMEHFHLQSMDLKLRAIDAVIRCRAEIFSCPERLLNQWNYCFELRSVLKPDDRVEI